jgi:hypothetical protein
MSTARAIGDRGRGSRFLTVGEAYYLRNQRGCAVLWETRTVSPVQSSMRRISEAAFAQRAGTDGAGAL